MIGQTGTGKSTALENLILQDIHAGRGCTLIDPHGDIAERIANAIPRSRINETIYFDPADREHPIGFNPLADVAADERELVASSIVAAFKGLWIESWGEWLEYLLKNSLLALLEYPAPGLSLAALPRFLSNAEFRARVLRHCTDPVVREFWDDWFLELDKREELARVVSTMNKVGKLVLSPTLRNILGQRRSGFDFRRVMDERQILIVNLSKGRLGADNANLLGSLIVSHIVHQTMQRAGVPECERVDHHLYIDEFQNFTTREFESILSEARKYRLSLAVAHQYLDQLNPNVLKAVLGNVGTLAVFAIGATDAEGLALEFSPFRTDVLTTAGRGEAWVRYRNDGEYQSPKKVQTFEPADELQRSSLERVRRASRMRFARSRRNVEASLACFYGT